MSILHNRQLTRVGFQTQIDIYIDSQKVAEAETENLSIKGVLVKSSALKKDDHCHIVICLPGENAPKMDFEGKVLRVNENNEAAIFFEEMSIDAFDHLKKLISLNDGDPEKIHKEFLDHVKSHMTND